MMISFLFKKVELQPSARIEKVFLLVYFTVVYKLVAYLSVVAVLKVRNVAA